MTDAMKPEGDDLELQLHDEKDRGPSPKKPYYDNYTDIQTEIDEPVLFELAGMFKRNEIKEYPGTPPTEKTLIGMIFVLLDEEKKPVIDAETNKPLAVLLDITQPKASSYEFFQKSGIFQTLQKLKLVIDEDQHKQKMVLRNLIGLRARMMIEIKSGVSKRTGKPWKFPKISSIQAPKDKADIDSNKVKFAGTFVDP